MFGEEWPCVPHSKKRNAANWKKQAFGDIAGKLRNFASCMFWGDF